MNLLNYNWFNTHKRSIDCSNNIHSERWRQRVKTFDSKFQWGFSWCISKVITFSINPASLTTFAPTYCVTNTTLVHLELNINLSLINYKIFIQNASKFNIKCGQIYILHTSLYNLSLILIWAWSIFGRTSMTKVRNSCRNFVVSYVKNCLN